MNDRYKKLVWLHHEADHHPEPRSEADHQAEMEGNCDHM
jgi:hypothetical protein